MIRMHQPVMALLCTALAGGPMAPQHAPGQPVNDAVAGVVRGASPKPKLVVVISVDQLRADLLTRYADLLLPAGERGRRGGFQHLMDSGAYYANARYAHFPLFTGPGHAVIMTGGHPYKTGVVGNAWWDSAERLSTYCVAQPSASVVGAAAGSRAQPMGPANLLSSTVGDELKLATAGRAKVVSIALKDRAAIFLGGHSQDTAIWYDARGGRWISSSVYCPDGSLPSWVEAVNQQQIPAASLTAVWVPLDPEALRGRTLPPSFKGRDIPLGFGDTFPHALHGCDNPLAAFTFMPDANDYVFRTAEAALAGAELGADETPDILAINLSTNDYVGHAFGPYSPEAADLVLRTDRQLARFIDAVESRIDGGLGRVVMVLTADHGVSPIPEDAAAMRLPAGRFRSPEVLDAIEDSLARRFGASGWVSQSRGDRFWSDGLREGGIWLDPSAIKAAIESGRAASRREIEQAACDAVNAAGIRGVYACYGKTQILEGAIADHDLAAHLARGIHPRRSADLLIIPEPMHLQEPMPGGPATSHGTPYIYDTHVPIILSADGIITPGVYLDPVSPADIAPTLSVLLGIEFPSACDGHPLLGALRLRRPEPRAEP